MMRGTRWVLVAAALLLAGPARAQTADQIIEKHLDAMGGREALGKLTSQVSTGTIAVSAQGADIGGSLEIYHKAPNKARTYFKLDLSAFGAGEMVVDQRCDGKTAFSMNSMQGDREITGSQLQGLLNATFPTPLLDYKGAGGKVELAGKDKLNGRDHYIVVYTPKVGSASRQYVDAETFLVSRVVSKADVPELGGEVEQTTDVSDYRSVDGIKVPFSVKVQNSAQSIGITLSKVENNKPIDDAMFAKPTK
jgi:outer membrane lipoprotein-sorting protein